MDEKLNQSSLQINDNILKNFWEFRVQVFGLSIFCVLFQDHSRCM